MLDRVLTWIMGVICAVETVVAVVVYLVLCAAMLIPVFIVALPLLLLCACYEAMPMARCRK